MRFRFLMWLGYCICNAGMAFLVYVEVSIGKYAWAAASALFFLLSESDRHYLKGKE